jgi:hypothetical protein
MAFLNRDVVSGKSRLADCRHFALSLSIAIWSGSVAAAKSLGDAFINFILYWQ